MPIEVAEYFKITRRLQVILALAMMTISCSNSTSQELKAISGRDDKQLKLQIPDAGWVPIFFEGINERAKLAKLSELKSTALPDGDFEIRVWSGFGVSKLEGFVIKRTAGQGSAAYIPPVKQTNPSSNYSISVAPKSGWEQLWGRLTDYGILTLPDSSQLQDGESPVTDGIYYVVEINMNKTYRTYMYGNPEKQDSPEAKRMVSIINTLNEELIGRR